MKLGFKEKFAYGIGAVGKDMVYMLSASYILYYYQDIMGVSAWVMGIILLIARVFDAFNDPLMGVLVAKTKTKFGKFRPWLFIGTLTNAVVLFFMFAAPPSLNAKGMIAYAAVFYILWGVTYTMMDIPYWSMVPAFTESGKERENMSALGRSCAGVGSAIITIVTVLAVAAIGNFALSKTNDNVTKQFNNTFDYDGVSAYVAELDEAGNTTGNVKEISHVKIDVKASAKEFENETSFNNSNCNFDVFFKNAKGYTTGQYTKDDCSMDIVTDDLNYTALAVIYLSSDKFGKIDNEESSMNMNITSTKEVDRLGFKYFSLIVAILFFVFILITCLFIKEKSTVDVQTASIGDMFKALVQNDQAMAIVITIVLVNSSVYITSNLLIYFFKYDIGGASWQGNYTLFNTFGGGIQILAMMLFFPIMRKFINTLKMFYVSVISAIFGYVVLLVMALSGVNSVYLFFVPGFFIFGAVGLLNVLVTVFLANTVDYGEIKNNRRDESVIFSMQTFVVKLASGIAALAAAVSLSVFNISKTDVSFEAVDGSLITGLKTMIENLQASGAVSVSGGSIIGLRFVMTVLPMIVLVIALFIFKAKYKLNDEKLAEITGKIKERRDATSKE
ncbi:MFS/sugar transport protein [Lachnospiraceae bacterium G41]|nr:MFS/sugar transport protein [Lachnospiraceae bacterium G41]